MIPAVDRRILLLVGDSKNRMEACAKLADLLPELSAHQVFSLVTHMPAPTPSLILSVMRKSLCLFCLVHTLANNVYIILCSVLFLNFNMTKDTLRLQVEVQYNGQMAIETSRTNRKSSSVSKKEIKLNADGTSCSNELDREQMTAAES